MALKKEKVSKDRLHESIDLRLDKLNEQRKTIASGMQLLIEVLRKMPSEETEDSFEEEPRHKTKRKEKMEINVMPSITELVVVGTDRIPKMELPKIQLTIPPMPQINPSFGNFAPTAYTSAPEPQTPIEIDQPKEITDTKNALKLMPSMKPHTEKESPVKEVIKPRKLSFFMQRENSQPQPKAEQKEAKKEEKKPASIDANESVLRTVADDLLELVKKDKRISIEDAAKKLSIPLATMQSLVDMLVEEKVFGIEYKFTTPYIYLYSDGAKGAVIKDKNLPEGLITKEQFYENAKSKNVPYEFIEGMWRKYLQENMTSIRDEFLIKAKEKKLSAEKIESLWNKYLSYL